MKRITKLFFVLVSLWIAAITSQTGAQVEQTEQTEQAEKVELVDMYCEPALVRASDGGLHQAVLATFKQVNKPVDIMVSIDAQAAEKLTLNTGEQDMEILVGPVEKEKEIKVRLEVAGQLIAERAVMLKPVRKWEMHLVHQTHLDIGYTHPQEEVLKTQVEHIKNALKYINDTKDYPEEAKFKWHPEGMWAVEEFLRTATEQEKNDFIEASKKGYIHNDVLYAQAMTGIYSEEELMELMGCAKRFEKQYGIKIDSAMQTDVPGYTWGFVTALAQNGVKYMSVGPNGGWRVGHVFEWGDKPFYWVSPSGKEKILFWMAGKGYAQFHGCPIGHRIERGRIFRYLNELAEKQYPYDMVQLRYNIGADNGPPNPALPDFVKEWNEKYVYPKLIIAKNSEMMKELEKRYASQIPVVKGDFTPHWEDGAASTSADIALNRRTCEKIVQAQTLWAMLNSGPYQAEEFDQAWTKLIMYDEHTWGAWCSTEKPDDPFTIQQANYKQKFALDGERMTNDLMEKALAGVRENGSNTIDVYNTFSQTRTELVVLSAEMSTAGDVVKDGKGKKVRSQRLASGELAFVAKKVPAFGSKRYTIEQGENKTTGSARAAGLTLSNKLVSLEIDAQSGAIRSLRHKSIKADLVDSSKGVGLNDYLYILGTEPDKGHNLVAGPVQVVIEDAGPLVAGVSIESLAPGCRKLTRKIRIVDGSDQIELINIVDKLRETAPEGVYFTYPMNVPGGKCTIDIPWASMQPEKDQLKGANRNFYCVQRWVDISNDDYGINWVTVDAPILQFDPIVLASKSEIKDWRTKIEPGQTFYSWVMNNHWETNYKAYQEGVCTFKYVLRPHKGAFDEVAAQELGRSIHQPLIAVATNASQPVIKGMLEMDDDDGVVVSSVRPSRQGKAIMVRLFNTSDKQQEVSLDWRDKPKAVWISNPMEENVSGLTDSVEMVAHEVVTLRVELEGSESR